jgi:hypothetical protein
MEDNPEVLRPKNDREDKARFWELVKEMPLEEDLTEHDIRCLIKRAGFLNKKERAKYKNVFIRENLTPSEYKTYNKLKLLDKYFPLKKNVEAHYGDC